MATLRKGTAESRYFAHPAPLPEAEGGTRGAFPDAGSAVGLSPREAAEECAGVAGTPCPVLGGGALERCSASCPAAPPMCSAPCPCPSPPVQRSLRDFGEAVALGLGREPWRGREPLPAEQGPLRRRPRTQDHPGWELSVNCKNSFLEKPEWLPALIAYCLLSLSRRCSMHSRSRCTWAVHDVACSSPN